MCSDNFVLGFQTLYNYFKEKKRNSEKKRMWSHILPTLVVTWLLRNMIPSPSENEVHFTILPALDVVWLGPPHPSHSH